jgi:CheY-like chemotaxis protein
LHKLFEERPAYGTVVTMSKPVIFWVEDNPNDVLLLRGAFAEAGVDVEIVLAEHALAAFRYFDLREPYREAPAPPDLVIIDINLPAISGRTILNEVRRHRLLKYVPVVVLTSSSHPGELRACLESGATECITKPSGLNGYAEVVDRLRKYLPLSGANPAIGSAEPDPTGPPDAPSSKLLRVVDPAKAPALT